MTTDTVGVIVRGVVARRVSMMPDLLGVVVLPGDIEKIAGQRPSPTMERTP
jgi:hypothetical protein